jgi:hypothetical protein
VVTSHKHKGRVLTLVTLKEEVEGFRARPIDSEWPRALRDDIKRLGDTPWVAIEEGYVHRKLVQVTGGPSSSSEVNGIVHTSI